MSTYHFAQHDDGGRIISIDSFDTNTYEEALDSANEKAKKINSHGVTYCNAKGESLEVPRDYLKKKYGNIF